MSEYLDKPLRTEEQAMADVVKLHDPLYTELRSLHGRLEELLSLHRNYDKDGTTAQRSAFQTAELASDTLRIAYGKIS